MVRSDVPRRSAPPRGLGQAQVIPRLHDPANVQQTSSKLPANVFKIHLRIARCLLKICWTFAGRLLDRVNGVLDLRQS